MRIENTKVKITIPIPINKPDANGIIYTKEAVENAINNLDRYLPIVYKENEETDTKVIGSMVGLAPAITCVSDNNVNITIDGVIFYSGAEIIVNEMTKDGKISDFRIVSIGLTV